MKCLGLLIIIVAVLLPVPWFFDLANNHSPTAIFSQYLGSIALILMGFVQLLAIRARPLEMVFGPLDKIYVLHKWLAFTAIIATMLHDTIDADVHERIQETWLSDLAESLGEVGLYGLLLLTFATLIPFIPYHLWRFSHKFMGLFFAFSAFHYVFILKPFQVMDPVGLYVLAFCIIGIGAYIYMLLYHGIFPRPHEYHVTHIDHHGDVMEITLDADKKPIKTKPGQFVFIHFNLPNLKEVHPFTLSGGDGKTLKIAIKSLGNYTEKLAEQLKVGDGAFVRGAYGRFLMPKKYPQVWPQVWIATGIGITPFLAWLRALKENPQGPVYFYYCVRNKKAPFIDEIQALSAKFSAINLSIITQESDRLTPQKIMDDVGHGKTPQVFFCGSDTMRDAFKKDFKQLGLPKSHFHYEAFKIRSGLGIRWHHVKMITDKVIDMLGRNR